MGQYDEAEVAYREALPVLQRPELDGDPAAAFARAHLASLLRDTGRFDQAAEEYHRALRQARPILSPDGRPHPARATSRRTWFR